MNVDDLVQQRIEAARRREADRKRQRAELAAARAAGLARRHAAKLHRLHGADDHADVAQTATTAPSRGDTATTANPPKERLMAATKPVFTVLLCPACRTQRRCRTVGVATVGKRRREVLQCTDTSCELVWCPGREHLTGVPNAA